MVFFENFYRTQTAHWYQHCHQNSRALWHFSHQVSDSFFLWGTVLYFCCVNRFFLPSVGRSQTSVLILICPLQSILTSIFRLFSVLLPNTDGNVLFASGTSRCWFKRWIWSSIWASCTPSWTCSHLRMPASWTQNRRSDNHIFKRSIRCNDIIFIRR